MAGDNRAMVAGKQILFENLKLSLCDLLTLKEKI